MKNKKMMIALIVVMAVVAVMTCVYFALRPDTQVGNKTITVQVVHKDGTIKEFTYQTDAEFLADVLVAEGLISGSMSEYGLTIETVDGVTADWGKDNAYWALYIGDDYANTGISSTPVTDGAVYKLVYEAL